uniref:Uncharacterized protein n=1 Tax=Arundo donax TaxID=35708 RepID=A0A0A8XY46_ARUDO
MCAISSLSKFSFVFDSSFSSYLLTRPDSTWLTVSWTTAELTISAIRIQVSVTPYPAQEMQCITVCLLDHKHA